MFKRVYTTKETVLIRGREAIGIPLKNIDQTGRLSTGKGAVGNVLEESWFDLKVNNEAQPDFVEAGVELKATPYLKTTKGIRAKERLVCNIINYMTEYDKTFQTSNFWKKCNTMLIMSYEHKKDFPKGDFTIDEVALFSFPVEDLIIIEQDWETIISKVRSGKAHEISESDTLYLGACTKGVNASSVREQPFSDIFAKQRAYSLKQSYMTYILNAFIYGNQKSEQIIKDPEALKHLGFEDYLRNLIKPYIGMSQYELKHIFGIISNAKNLNEMILSKMLKVSNIEDTAEFKKADIMVKTIRLEASGNSIEQSMSFPSFSFKEVAKGEWEESKEYEFFVEQKYLFTVFKKDDLYNTNKKDKSFTQKHIFLDNVYLWQLPERDRKEVKRVWEETARILKEGVRLEKVKYGTSYRMENNLPKMKDSRIAHVRPHTSVSSYEANNPNADKLPDGRWMTKQCFWLNSKYIMEQLKLFIS